MYEILSFLKIAIAHQNHGLVGRGDVEVDFREHALRAVSRLAMERRTGARGLRTLLEHVLLDTMYDLPSNEDVTKVVVDEAVINGDAQPYLIYNGGELKSAVSSD